MKIKDNFLKQEELDKIQQLMRKQSPFEGHQTIFPWYYSDRILFKGDVDKFRFIHVFYENHMPLSPFMNELNPILDIIQPISIFRIKVATTEKNILLNI